MRVDAGRRAARTPYEHLPFCSSRARVRAMVLQLSRELRRLGRGRVVSLANEGWTCLRALDDAQGRAPCQKFHGSTGGGWAVRSYGPLGKRLGCVLGCAHVWIVHDSFALPVKHPLPCLSKDKHTQ